MLKWLATFFFIWFVYHVRSVFPPIIVGAILAYLLLPLVQSLSSSAKISVPLACTVVYLSGACVLGLTVWFLGPGVVRELGELAANQQEIVTNVVRQFAEVSHWEGDIEGTANQILDNIKVSFGTPQEIVHIGGLLSHGFLFLLVCLVSSIYFIVDSELVGKFLLRYVPEDRRKTVITLAGQMNRVLSRYVQGQILLIVIMSTVAWLFLHFVIHMRYALPVAILSGVLEIIPVLGPILATTTATLVGISQFGAGTAVAIVVFYTLARWFEDYIVVPKIIGHAVELHPLAVIFAVLCGEVMAGGLGMLIAIPVAACVKLSIDFFYLGRVPETECEGKGEG